MNKELQKDITKLNQKLIAQKSYSSLLRRIWATVLDGLIVIAIFTPGYFVLESVMNIRFTNILFTLICIYYISSKRQATLGMYFAGIRFSTIDGMRITPLRVIIRVLVASVEQFVMCYVGYVAGFMTGWAIGSVLGTQYFIIGLLLSMILSIVIFLGIVYLPYFITMRKQLWVDLLTGMVVLRDDSSADMVKETESSDEQKELTPITKEI